MQERKDFDTGHKTRHSLDEIIVVSPGSASFKFGIASKKSPVAVPSLVGLRMKNTTIINHKNDYMDIPIIKPDKAGLFKLNKIRQVLKSIVDGYIIPPTEQQIKNEEKYTEENSVEFSEDKIIDQGFTSQFVFGENVFQLKENSPYRVVPILKSGVLNIEEISQPVLTDIVSEYIKYAITEKLSILSENFDKFCIAFVLPVNFCKSEILFFVEIFLQKLGFKAILLHLEPVLACFGTGFSGACVVDIGDQSTKICCVQYGSIVYQSRIFLPFGGHQITNFLLNCLVTPEINEYYSAIKSHYDYADKRSLYTAVEKIKLETCLFPSERRLVKNAMVDLVLRGGERETKKGKSELETDIEERVIETERKAKVKMTLSNVCCLAPLGLFMPEMLSLPGLTEKGQHFLLHKNDEVKFTQDSFLMNKYLEKNSIPIHSKSAGPIKIRYSGLSSAIFESISSLPKQEDKMSFATSILLVGGSSKIPNLSEYVVKSYDTQKNLHILEPMITRFEILPKREEADSADMISWQGMSIICGNEGCREMWVSKQEWEKQPDMFLLRKRICFELDNESIKTI